MKAIQTGWEAARRAHGSLALSLEAFTSDVLELVQRSRVRLGLPTDTDGVAEDVLALHFEDLYLARLCERGDERAWAAFVARYEPDLRSVLRRESDAAEAESVAAEVLSEVALAPPTGGSRTRLGRYDGTGPLWAWLATIGIRTARAHWRRRREVQLEAAGHDRASSPESPAPEVEDQVAAFVDTLRDGWAHLETKERLAIAWKHRDGLPQRRIARLLGVSEPTVSRLVSRGVAKLKGCFTGAGDGAAPPDAALWTRLEAALAGFFERSGTPPPQEVE